jgi:UDP-4-amino-4,6-dideoxy-N-acetyl-beta-L-altrosamine transaminase
MTSAPFLPYGRHVIDEDDILAVSNALRSDWLTTGPAVEEFEQALARTVGAQHAVVCNSGTAALYLAAKATRLEPGEAVIVPAITFAATASACVLAGLEVVFADVDPQTGLTGVEHAAEALARGGSKQHVRAILPVHLGGRVGDPAALHKFASENDLLIIEDACHAIGTSYGNGSVEVGGCHHSLAACFSFHPVKSLAMGEGGAITTNSAELADCARLLRNHGMSRDPETFDNQELAFGANGTVNPWYYEIDEISHNMRASDINCALGASQLRKLRRHIDARRKLIERYRRCLSGLAPTVQFISSSPGSNPGWHLCAVLVEFDALGVDRGTVMRRLRERGIGTQVHYIPVSRQPFYRRRYGDIVLDGAESYYRRTLTLPLFPTMTDADVDRVVDSFAESLHQS